MEKKFEITTKTIEIKVLKLDNKQMTLSVLRQIEEEYDKFILTSLFKNECGYNVKILGWCNYFPDFDWRFHKWCYDTLRSINIIYVNTHPDYGDNKLHRAYIPKEWIKNINQLFIAV